MKFLVVAGVVVLSLVILGGGNPIGLWQTFQQLYPADPAQRQALDECFAQDPQMNRLDTAAREACLRRMLPGTEGSTEASTAMNFTGPGRGANPVDLWRAAGQGPLSRSDVRAEQQNARFINAPGSTQMR